MIDPDDLELMTAREKMDLLRSLDTEVEWDSACERIFAALLHDLDPHVRELAVQRLADLDDPKHIPMIIDVADRDPDVETRARAAEALGIYVADAMLDGGLPEADYLELRRFLIDLARDASSPLVVRARAIESLGFDGGDDVCQLIEWAYGHMDMELRISAVIGMGRARSEIWSETILGELRSNNNKMRLAAIEAAGETGLPEATPLLRAYVMRHDRETILASLYALARTRGPGAVEALEMRAQSQDPEVRQAAEDAIEDYYAFEADYEEDNYDKPF